MKKTLYYLAVASALIPKTLFAQETTLPNPFGGAGVEPIQLIAVITQALLGIVGAGALLMFVLGGMNMIFAAGNEEKITKGRTILIWAAIGLAVVLTSYSVLTFTFNLFQRAATGN